MIKYMTYIKKNSNWLCILYIFFKYNDYNMMKYDFKY